MSEEGAAPPNEAAAAAREDPPQRPLRRRSASQDRRFLLAAFHRPPLIDVVQDALRRGANVDVDLLDYGALAIDVASLMGNVPLIRVLLQHGADINHVGRDGFCPLHRAVFTGNMAMTRLLLTTPTIPNKNNKHDNKIQVDLPTRDNPLTSLQILCTRGGSVAIAQLLINAGANVHIRDQESGESLAHVARTPQWLHLLRQYGVDVCEAAVSDGFTPLHYSCLRGNLPVVQYLVLQAKAPVHQHSRQGYSALHYACHKGHFEIVQWLVEHGGADPREVDDSGNSAFDISCTVKQTELAIWFMDHHGFTATEVATTGLSPLHYACLSTRTSESSDGIELVRALLQRQPADVRHDTPVMQLLLHLAVDWSPGICEILVNEYNFNLMAWHKERIPLQRAARQGTAETLACMAKLMQSRGLNLDTPDAHGWTALHSSVAKRDVQKVRILLEAGCSVHAVDIHGRTPLHVAARRLPCPSTERPQDPKEEEESDNKMASTKEEEDTNGKDLEIVHMLLDRGANPYCVDAHGRLPLSEDRTSLDEVFSMMQSAATLGLFENEACSRSWCKRPFCQARSVARKRLRSCW